MRKFIISFIILLFSIDGQAEILMNLDSEASKKALSLYRISVLEDDAYGLFYRSLDELTDTGPHGTEEDGGDCRNFDFVWNDDYRQSIAYWNTDIVYVSVSEWPNNRSNLVFPTHFKIAEKAYMVKYISFSVEAWDSYPNKLEIPNTVEAFWSKGYKAPLRNKLNMFPDTLIMGTSIRTNMLPFRGAEVLYLKAGIPYHKNDKFMYGKDFRTGIPVLYSSEGDTIRTREVHVPKGFKQYYLTEDSEMNALIVDDLPVVQCHDIRMRWEKIITTYFTPCCYDITGDTIAVAVGDSVLLDIVCEPYDATVRYSAKMSSSDESVATVDSLAMIRAVGVGTTVIKAEALDGSGVTSQIVLKVDTPESLEKPAADRRQDRLSDDRWYDLLGRPVSEPAEGIYIHRGRLEAFR